MIYDSSTNYWLRFLFSKVGIDTSSSLADYGVKAAVDNDGVLDKVYFILRDV